MGPADSVPEPGVIPKKLKDHGFPWSFLHSDQGNLWETIHRLLFGAVCATVFARGEAMMWILKSLVPLSRPAGKR